MPDVESVGSSVLHEVANTPSSRAEATAIGARWILLAHQFSPVSVPGWAWWVMVQVWLTERADDGPGSTARAEAATARMMITPCTVSLQVDSTSWKSGGEEQLQREGAGGGGEHPAASAAQHDTPEHDSRDGLELVAGADRGVHSCVADEEDAGDGGRERGQDERPGLDPPDLAAGEAGGVRVVAGGDQRAAERRRISQTLPTATATRMMTE